MPPNCLVAFLVQQFGIKHLTNTNCYESDTCFHCTTTLVEVNNASQQVRSVTTANEIHHFASFHRCNTP